MSDGNTATQSGIGSVGHNEEADMLNQVRKAFEYACNMITEASHLRLELNTFKDEFSALRQEVEKLRQSNSFLDDLATQLRKERDANGLRVHELEMALHERNRHISELERDFDNERASVVQLMQDIGIARNERDNAQLRVLELEEENKALKERLEAVNKALHPLMEVKPKAEEWPTTGQMMPEEVPQQEGESSGDYFNRVGRYPSEREARAAAQPRAETGQFVQGGEKPDTTWF